MHPIVTLLELGPRALPIGSYGVLLCAAISVAATGTLRAANAARLDLGAAIAVIGASIAGGFAGGALVHGLVQCIRYGSLHALLEPPGLTFFGALLGGGAAAVLCARTLRFPLLALADRAVPALALGHALGRVGCLLGGCCYGREWDGPLAVAYTHPLAPAAQLGAGLARHPLPLYEAAGALLLAACFAARAPRAPGSGERVAACAAAYAVLRFGLEFLRGDEVRGVFLGGALSTSQSIALGLVVVLALRTAHARLAPA
jgi:phosphatidylglycerol---prolipoprotein diacylglyceryl transferase